MPYDARAELRGILDTVDDVVVVVDEKWRILNLNVASAAQFGYRVHELIARPVSGLFLARGERKVLDSIRQTFTPGCARATRWQGVLLGRHHDGHTIIFEGRIGRYLMDQRVRYVLVLRDVGARRRAERALQRAALRDPLTRLFNRTAFSDELRRAIERAQRTNAGFALLLLDLDHFKEINDTVGHQPGDLLLRQTARRLREQVRRSDVLARLGGDEFAVLSDHAAAPSDSIALAERLIEALARPFHVAGVEAHIGTSIGVATFPEDAREGDQLLGRADLALYAAKASGRGTWRLFDGRMQRIATERRLLESELRLALREGQLKLLYQPLISLADLKVAGFEALLRWNHPVRGVLEPQEFVPFAERHRLIRPMTEWALGRAIDEVATLDPGESEALPTAVNISTRIFDQEGLVDLVERLNGRSRVPQMPLILEITEGALTEGQRTIDVLTALRQLGVRIAIDDFGIGYSSLARLKDLPLDLLKIDRSFIANLPHRNADRAVVDAIVRLGLSLGMVTVAEGVETHDQLRAVLDMGCDQAQGYLFASPMPIARIPGWLEDWRQRDRQRLLEWSGREPRLRLAQA
jgi:diguanylate cyclase (GGDEF)-like protein/PAS domain S-box-containing protein